MDFQASNQGGLTLLEMLTAIAIGAITLAIAVPGYQSLVERNRMASSVNTFVTHLYQARAEAVNRGEWVALCPSSDGTTCLEDHTQWGMGYLVFVDQDRNKRRDPEEPVLSHTQGDKDRIVIQSSSRHRRTLAYRPSGRAWGFNTTVRFCSEYDAKNNRTVVISATGRPRVNTTTSSGSISCQ